MTGSEESEDIGSLATWPRLSLDVISDNKGVGSLSEASLFVAFLILLNCVVD